MGKANIQGEPDGNKGAGANPQAYSVAAAEKPSESNTDFMVTDKKGKKKDKGDKSGGGGDEGGKANVRGPIY
jgi:hypothetical protein